MDPKQSASQHLPSNAFPASSYGSTSSRSRHLALAWAILSIFLLAACSDEDNGGLGPNPEAGPEITLGQINQADNVEFDVVWSADTRVAEESTVMSDVEDLQAPGGIYRISAGSPMLDGLEVGDVVVWPQLGMFNILGIQEQGDVVEVATEWARFSDAVHEANIEFSHALTSGAPGRAVGVSPAGPSPAQHDSEFAYGVMANSAPVRITEDGVEFSHEAGGYDVSMQATGDRIDVSVSAGGTGVTTSLGGSVSGLSADGVILLDPESDDADPVVALFFDDVTLSVQAALELSGSRGGVTISPNAALVFPFMIGPIPAFVAVGTRLQIRSSISRADANLQASAGFTAVGDVAVGRNPGGGFAAEGDIRTFQVDGPDFGFEVSNTSGMGLDFDAPRITFGLGRPGLAPLAIYGTQSAELTANVVLNSDAEYCARTSSAGAVTVGGELNMLVWSAGTQRIVAQRDGPSRENGPGC